MLAACGDDVYLARGDFAGIGAFAAELGWDTVDGVVFDLGISSVQLDDAARGFSFELNGPLDMRMHRTARRTAATLLNKADELELRRIFRDFGEEPRATALARAIVHDRQQRPWTETGQLAALVQRVAGAGGEAQARKAKARVFQALRIAVNDELAQLEAGLTAAVDLLAPTGRLAAISFHSLEDRRVKRCFVHEAADCVCPPDLPVCTCAKVARLKVLTRKPLTPTPAEVENNNRARSAKLRVAERLTT